MRGVLCSHACDRQQDSEENRDSSNCKAHLEREKVANHRRIRGSKRKVTGNDSPGKPDGSGPNDLALAAASTAPCASASNEYTPDRVTSRMLDGGTDPSRLMMKNTSARSAPCEELLNWRAICRTMFSRYPGYGKSIPLVFTVTTSAPRPPVSPPPATVGVLVSGFASVGVDGVASGVADFFGGAFGAGIS